MKPEEKKERSEKSRKAMIDSEAPPFCRRAVFVARG
jgi:hypothetical protein